MSVEEDKMIRIVLSSGGTYMSPVTSLKERTLEALRDTFRSYVMIGAEYSTSFAYHELPGPSRLNGVTVILYDAKSNL